jgi:putative dehydrogenase
MARPTGRVLVELSTLPLSVKQRAAEDIALKGCSMLDCPVSGTGAQAVSRDLTVFASGDEDAFKKSEAAINGMSRQVLYLGKFGNGSTMKFIANHIVTIHNTAVAEALILAEKAGLDVSVVYEALRDSAATSRMFQIRGPLIVEKRYTNPSMRISTYMKDLDRINEFASGLRCPTPLFNVCAQLYYAAQSSGYGELDTAGVAKVLESMAGLGLGQGHHEIN